MGSRQERQLARHADRLRVKYLDAVNRGDLDLALAVGVDELVPVSEQLAEGNERYLNPLGVTERNLAAICHRLGRPVGALRYVQAAFHVTMELSSRGLAIDPFLADIPRMTVDVATGVAESRLSRDSLPRSEQQMIVHAAALIPHSIELMGELDAFRWACQLRITAIYLRALTHRDDVKFIDHESRSMVYLARLAAVRGDRTFALAEIKEALQLWITQLDQGQRYWSTQLLQTWTVAAELLDSFSSHVAAASVRRVIEQAVGTRHGFLGLSGIAEVLDVREHYRAALAALP